MSAAKNLGFGPERRLSTRTEFRKVFAGGVSTSGQHFSVVVLPHPQEKRLGLTLRRGLGNAPQRNRLKRRLREIFRARQHDLKPGSLIMIPKDGAASLTWEQCREQVVALWQRAKVL